MTREPVTEEEIDRLKEKVRSLAAQLEDAREALFEARALKGEQSIGEPTTCP